MKSKIILIPLIFALFTPLDAGGIMCQYIPPPEPGETKVVIGMSRSLTGPLAIIHESAFGAIYPIYIQMVNDAGGISVGGLSFDADFKVLNNNSEESRLVEHTNTLIGDVYAGEVHTIFGPCSNLFVYVMVPIANAGKCVLMTAEGGATSLMLPGYLDSWPYVFINLSFSDWYQLPVLAQMLVEAHQAYYGGNATPTAYIFWQDDMVHGPEYLAIAAEYFPAAGISIVGNQSVLDTLSPDYAALVAAANATSPDIVCCFCYPDEVCGLTETAIDLNFNVDAWVTGPGGNFGWFGGPDGVGAAAEGVICFATANNKTSVDMKWLFNDVLEPEVGLEGLDFWGHPLYWAALQMWQNAVEAVGQFDRWGYLVIDQDELRDELASYNSYANGVDTVLGRTWYTMLGDGGGILAYECHPGEIGQWQNGYVEIIGGNNTTSTLQYPKPAWP